MKVISIPVLSRDEVAIVDQYYLIATGVRPACCIECLDGEENKLEHLNNLISFIKTRRRDLDCCKPIAYDIGPFYGFAANQKMVDAIVFANSLSGDNPMRHIILGLVFGYSPVAIDKFFRNDYYVDYVI